MTLEIISGRVEVRGDLYSDFPDSMTEKLLERFEVGFGRGRVKQLAFVTSRQIRLDFTVDGASEIRVTFKNLTGSGVLAFNNQESDPVKDELKTANSNLSLISKNLTNSQEILESILNHQRFITDIEEPGDKF